MKLYKFENMVTEENAKGKVVSNFHKADNESTLIVEYTDGTFSVFVASVFVADEDVLHEGLIIETEENQVDGWVRNVILEKLPNQKYSEVTI